MICVSEVRVDCAVHEKINKNKTNDRKKLGILFDGAMSNATGYPFLALFLSHGTCEPFLR
jgi:hypothetical protein